MIDRDGAVLAAGTVVAIERSVMGRDGDSLWRLRYEYRDTSGLHHIGESGNLSADEAESWQPGDIGGVRYDADDPARSAWTGSLLPRSAGDS